MAAFSLVEPHTFFIIHITRLSQERAFPFNVDQTLTLGVLRFKEVVEFGQEGRMRADGRNTRPHAVCIYVQRW